MTSTLQEEKAVLYEAIVILDWDSIQLLLGKNLKPGRNQIHAH